MSHRGCPAMLEDGLPCGKDPAICAGHYRALEAALRLAADFIARSCIAMAHEHTKREAKALDGLIATTLRRVSPSGGDHSSE